MNPETLSDFSEAHPRFYVRARYNKRKSVEEDAPIHDEIEMCEIRFAGNKDTVHHHRAKHGLFLQRGRLGEPGVWITPATLWADEYKAFQEGREQLAGGTPLIHMTSLDAGAQATLKAMNVHTVETLAGMNAPEKLGMNGDAWVEQAKAFLQKIGDTGHVAKLERELAELKAQMQTPEEPAQLIETSEDKVTEEGPFKDMSGADLKAYIKDATGQGVRGTPKLSTLLDMAKDAASELAKDAS